MYEQDGACNHARKGADMKKRDEIKRILTEYAEQQQNRSGGGAFGRAEPPRLAKTLDQYAAEIEKLVE